MAMVHQAVVSAGASTMKPEAGLDRAGLRALALSVLVLFPVHATPADTIPENLPHAFDAGWEGRKTCEVLFEDSATRVARCVFPPGVGHEKHYHNPHWGYVLECSTLLIRDDQGERTVVTEAGGSWSTDKVTVHEAVNTGEATTSYLIVESRVE